MDMFVIKGGIPLRGTVAVSGAKNAALPIMAASLAAEGTTRLHGVPDLVDVRTLSSLLIQLGMSVRWSGPETLELSVVDESTLRADYDLVRRMRASVCVLGPLLARRKSACVSLPGGCNIGHRPIDLHLKGLAALGADIRIERGYVLATAERLKGTTIDLAGPHGPTVTGTCNIMSAAVLAQGTTVISSAAREPEVVDLGNYLNRMGARISGLGSSTLVIEGVESLAATDYTIIPDRIEAATLLIAAAVTRGDLTVRNAQPEHLTAVLAALEQIGVELRIDANSIRARGQQEYRPLRVTALPYPGFPTDVQAQLTVLLTQAAGTSIVSDTVFPDRFMHVSELARLNTTIHRLPASASITGPSPLSGATLMASDLRASAALVLAGLAAQGDSVVRRIYHLDRGYFRLEEKLASVGAHIRRVKDLPENVPASLRSLEPAELAGIAPVTTPAPIPAPHFQRTPASADHAAKISARSTEAR